MRPKCKLCESLEIVEAYSFRDYQLLKCKKCNLLFTNQAHLPKNLYSQEYFTKVHPNYFGYCTKDYLNKRSKKVENFTRGIKLIEKYKAPGKILDVGCAIGVFLDIAKKRGWEVFGVDISHYAVEQAKKNFGIVVKEGELTAVKFSGKKFDVITMWDFIEHVPDPNKTLSEAWRILKDDGILFIHTINEDSLMSKLAHLSYYVSFKKIKKLVQMIHPIHHNFHYSKLTLEAFLRKHNFKVLYQEKSEMPVENIEQGITTKCAAFLLYFFSKILNQQHEIKLVVKKM